MSDRYRNPRVRQRLDVFARGLRKAMPSSMSSAIIMRTTSWICLKASSSVLPHVEAPYRSSEGQ